MLFIDGAIVLAITVPMHVLHELMYPFALVFPSLRQPMKTMAQWKFDLLNDFMKKYNL